LPALALSASAWVPDGWRFSVDPGKAIAGMLIKLPSIEEQEQMMQKSAPCQRCSWAIHDPQMQAYHDIEWGVPVRDARLLWETLMLEGFQAGLSWQIILRKRNAFREAFADFEPLRVAAFTDQDLARLLTNPGIVRSRAKIEATIRGARIYIEMAEGGEDFASFCWSFTRGSPLSASASAAEPELAASVSRTLKLRGFKFVGPTIAYAWMQAVGLVNDHEPSCFRRLEIERLGKIG
jgi:DNA-3-methyladenine glycosylase I